MTRMFLVIWLLMVGGVHAAEPKALDNTYTCAGFTMVALDRALVFDSDGNRICCIPRRIAEKAGCTTGTECVVEGVPMDEATVDGQKVVVIEDVSVTVLVPSPRPR